MISWQVMNTICGQRECNSLFLKFSNLAFATIYSERNDVAHHRMARYFEVAATQMVKGQNISQSQNNIPTFDSTLTIETLTKAYEFYKRAGRIRKTLHIAYYIALEYSFINRHDLALL